MAGRAICFQKEEQHAGASRGDEDEEGDICCVCQWPMRPATEAVTRMKCAHEFHQEVRSFKLFPLEWVFCHSHVIVFSVFANGSTLTPPVLSVNITL